MASSPTGMRCKGCWRVNGKDEDWKKVLKEERIRFIRMMYEKIKQLPKDRQKFYLDIAERLTP